MTKLTHPSDVLYAGNRPFPKLAACEHLAGSEKMHRKALQIQAEMSVNNQPVFDIAADCEDGAPAGEEREHAKMIAGILLCSENRFKRVGVRIHDVRHQDWRDELEIIISQAGRKVAYVVLPKPEFAEVSEASTLLVAAQDAAWAPIQHEGKLHDRASYRYYWELLQRAQATGKDVADRARQRFFA